MKDGYICGRWKDSNGNINEVHYKNAWWGHVFTDEENKRLLAGDEISFLHKEKVITGHLQYRSYKDVEYYGFAPSYDKEYDKTPVFRDPINTSYERDREKEAVIAAYMDVYYYGALLNSDGTKVSKKRIACKSLQKKGIDIILVIDGRRYVVDEKAQTDYIYNPTLLPTFALELLNGKSGKIGWFINDTLETTHYMFIWPQAKKNAKPLCPEGIRGVIYALVDKKRLREEVEKKYKMNQSQLLNKAKCMINEKWGEPKYDRKNEICIGYKCTNNGFNKDGYLYYTLKKNERPVNLVVQREWLKSLCVTWGKLGKVQD